MRYKQQKHNILPLSPSLSLSPSLPFPLSVSLPLSLSPSLSLPLSLSLLNLAIHMCTPHAGSPIEDNLDKKSKTNASRVKLKTVS